MAVWGVPRRQSDAVQKALADIAVQMREVYVAAATAAFSGDLAALSEEMRALSEALPGGYRVISTETYSSKDPETWREYLPINPHDRDYLPTQLGDAIAAGLGLTPIRCPVCGHGQATVVRVTHASSGRVIEVNEPLYPEGFYWADQYPDEEEGPEDWSTDEEVVACDDCGHRGDLAAFNFQQG